MDRRRRRFWCASIAWLAIAAAAIAGCRAAPAVNEIGEAASRTDTDPGRGQQDLIDRFHALYYSRKPYINTYLGIISAQYPNDNWMMQEMIAAVKPDFIIETGTLEGGTTLFYADILEKVRPSGRVITVDIVDKTQRASTFRNWQERVDFLQGSSVDPSIVDRIAQTVRGAGVVLVTLDSDHNKSHVVKELQAYAPLVTRDSYLVVQDTHLNGHPVRHISAPGEGPAEAVASFLTTTSDFVVDRN